MQQMLAGIAHEVRNPLAGIQLYAGILRDELAGDDARRPRRQDRSRGRLPRARGARLPRLRPPSRRPSWPRSSSRRACREVGELASARRPRPRSRDRVDDRAGLAVRADVGQLRRALLNLVKNAIAAAAEVGERGPAVRLSVSRAGEGAIARGLEPRADDPAEVRPGCSSRSSPPARRAPAWAWRSSPTSPAPTAGGSR
jgi:signal transduction histidine kinase